mgnify:CR=1 FL=1
MNNSTESGKRAIKDWQSNTTGGITRTVTVYDINGKEIAKYEGSSCFASIISTLMSFVCVILYTMSNISVSLNSTELKC